MQWISTFFGNAGIQFIAFLKNVRNSLHKKWLKVDIWLEARLDLESMIDKMVNVSTFFANVGSGEGASKTLHLDVNR